MRRGPCYRNAHVGVTLVIGERTNRAIDGNLVEIRTAQPAELGVVVGEVPPLQEWIVAEVDAGDHVRSHESDLLSLREVIVRVAIKHHLANSLHGNQILRNDFGGIENVEIKLRFVFLRQDLKTEFPFEEVAFLNGIEHVPAMEVWVLASQLHRFIPDQGMNAKDWLPMELHEVRLAFRVNEIG